MSLRSMSRYEDAIKVSRLRRVRTILAENPELRWEAIPNFVLSVGFSGKLSVCVVCAGRILGRGCHLKTLADKAVWEPETVTCDLC